MKKNHIGLIGCGYWGSKYLQIIKEKFPEIILYCAERKKNILCGLKSSFSDVYFWNEGEEMINSVRLDGLIIATEASNHYQLSKKALHLNIPILLEKPLFLNNEDFFDIYSKKYLIYEGYTFLRDNAISTFKDIIQKDNSKISRICFKWYAPGIKRKDINSLWDIGPHPLSILFYLLEDDFIPFEHELNKYSSSISLKNSSGIVANIRIDCDYNEKIRKVEAFIDDKTKIIYDHESYNRLYIEKENAKINIKYQKNDNLETQIYDFTNRFIIEKNGDISITEKILKVFKGIPINDEY